MWAVTEKMHIWHFACMIAVLGICVEGHQLCISECSW